MDAGVLGTRWAWRVAGEPGEARSQRVLQLCRHLFTAAVRELPEGGDELSSGAGVHNPKSRVH